MKDKPIEIKIVLKYEDMELSYGTNTFLDSESLDDSIDSVKKRVLEKSDSGELEQDFLSLQQQE